MYQIERIPNCNYRYIVIVLESGEKLVIGTDNSRTEKAVCSFLDSCKKAPSLAYIGRNWKRAHIVDGNRKIRITGFFTVH